MMIGMPDMRRHTPEPPAGAPEIQFKPGMADELLRELAPLLAEEGIDVKNLDVPDMDTLQQALSRAIERRNMAMFTPIGRAREQAAVTMRLAAEAIADGDTKLAAGILDQAQPESPDDSAATVAGCTGLALGLLDQWLAGHDTPAPRSATWPAPSSVKAATIQAITGQCCDGGWNPPIPPGGQFSGAVDRYRRVWIWRLARARLEEILADLSP